MHIQAGYTVEADVDKTTIISDEGGHRFEFSPKVSMADVHVVAEAHKAGLAQGRQSIAERARPRSEWHEDYGAVLWWRFPVDEPPYVGTPKDLGRLVEMHASQGPGRPTLISRGFVGGWPGYHTHWTPLTIPAEPRMESAQ